MMAHEVNIDADEALDFEDAKLYRSSTGRFQWIVPIRPDICFAVKELAHGLSSPTRRHFNILKHLQCYKLHPMCTG